MDFIFAHAGRALTGAATSSLLLTVRLATTALVLVATVLLARVADAQQPTISPQIDFS
jgi:hypothetical protein